jgi:putative flippase GtrA
MRIGLHQLIRYILVGLITVVVDVGGLYVLVQLGTSVYIAATISFAASLCVNFLLSRIWTFNARLNTPYQIVLYATLVLVNYLFTLAAINVAQHYHIGYLEGKIAAVVITTCWNFLLYKYVIFTKRRITLAGH